MVIFFYHIYLFIYFLVIFTVCVHVHIMSRAFEELLSLTVPALNKVVL